MGWIAFTPPVAANRGRFFSAALPQFTAATPAEAQAMLLPRPAFGTFPIRNAAPFHAALATVIEGLLERIAVPYLSGSGTLSLDVDFKGGTQQQPGIENLLRGNLPEALRTATSRDNLAYVMRFLPAEHWIALARSTTSILWATSSRTLTVDGESVTVFPPCAPSPEIGNGFTTTAWTSSAAIDLAADLRANVCEIFTLEPRPVLEALAAIGRVLGVEISGQNVAGSMYVLDYVDDVWSTGGVFSYWQDWSSPPLRPSLDLLWFCQAVLGLCMTTFADVPVTWRHPMRITTVEFVYTVAPDGTVSGPSQRSPQIVDSVDAAVSFSRGVSFTRSADEWDLGTRVIGGECECLAESALYDSDNDRPYALDVSELADKDAEVAAARQAVADAEAAATAAAAARDAKRDELFAMMSDAPGFNQMMGVDSSYVFLRIDGFYTSTTMYSVWQIPGGGEYREWIFSISNIMDWCRVDIPGFSAELDAFFSLREAASDASHAQYVALEELEETIDSADVIRHADILTDNLMQWSCTLPQEDKDWLDDIPSPTNIQCVATAHLTMPRDGSDPSGETVSLWPAAAVFAGGYVAREEIVSVEKYTDDVRLFAAGRETPDGSIVWLPQRTPPANPCRRVHVASSQGGSAQLASILATQLAAQALAEAASKFDTSAFTLPTPIQPGGHAGLWPTEAQVVAAIMDDFTNAELYFNKYRSTKLRDSAYQHDPADGDLYLPYKIVVNGDVVWRYPDQYVSRHNSVEVGARSQGASAPTFSEGFTLEHASHALLGIDWSWKSMPATS